MESVDSSQPSVQQQQNDQNGLVEENFEDLCLICCSKLPFKIDKENDDDKHLLSTNLSVIFLLRNLLQVPGVDLQCNLSECGNPGNWIKLCDTCCQLIKEAEEIHWKIIKFQQHLRSIQWKLVDKAKSALNEDNLVEQLQVKNDEGAEEGKKRRNPIWKKTRAFIETHDYLTDGIPLSSSFTEGDKLAGQLVNQVIFAVPEIKKEVEADFCWEDENDEVWGGSNDAMETGNNLNDNKKQTLIITSRRAKYQRRQITGYKDKWECQHCDKVFNCRRTRDNHEKSKHPSIPGQHICHICQRACNSHHLLLMHLRGKHKQKADGSPAPPKNVYRKQVSSPTEVKVESEVGTKPLPRRQRRTHEKGMIWECRHCDKVFSHRTTCESHEKSRHPAIPGEHVCNICGDARNSNLLLLMHKRKTHGVRADGTPVPLKTIKIPKKTTSTSVPKWECRYCDKVFYHRGTRNSHHHAKHPTIPGQHVCNICGKACNSNGYLLMHRRRAHNMKAGEGQSSSSNRTKNKPHNCLEEKAKFLPKACEICGVTLTSSGGLHNHMRFSHEKRYKENCDSCKMGFLSSTAFKMHLLAKHKEDEQTKRLVEEGARIWKCLVSGCPSKFMRKESLESHTERFHSKKMEKEEEGNEEEILKRYRCVYCGKGFWSGAKLRGHEAVHESEGTKNFKCELCGSGLITIKHLKEHQRRVHKVFVRKCSI